MIESLVRGALGQRLIVAVVAAILFFFGLDAARKLSVDAFPDVTRKLSVLPPCRWKWR